MHFKRTVSVFLIHDGVADKNEYSFDVFDEEWFCLNMHDTCMKFILWVV